jgi:GTP-binding protein HflX
MIRVSLVGYTNVGKSTLMNVFGKTQVLVENKLFATLDTTVRKVVVDRMPFLLSDTVGFIRKLPHHLVESFKSTLDEVRESDLLIQVVDISHPQFQDHIKVVKKTLKDLGAAEIPMLYVFNKMDLYRQNNLDEFLLKEEKTQLLKELHDSWQQQTNNNACFMAAVHKEGLVEFRDKIKVLVEELYEKRYPHKTRFW